MFLARTEQNETSNGSNLPIPFQVLRRNFTLSTLQRIWQRQFRIQGKSNNHLVRFSLTFCFCIVNDSTYEVDLLLSCIIVQKQIDSLDGKQASIQIPSARIAEIRREQGRISSSLSDNLVMVIFLHFRKLPAKRDGFKTPFR